MTDCVTLAHICHWPSFPREQMPMIYTAMPHGAVLLPSPHSGGWCSSPTAAILVVAEDVSGSGASLAELG